MEGTGSKNFWLSGVKTTLGRRSVDDLPSLVPTSRKTRGKGRTTKGLFGVRVPIEMT